MLERQRVLTDGAVLLPIVDRYVIVLRAAGMDTPLRVGQRLAVLRHGAEKPAVFHARGAVIQALIPCFTHPGIGTVRTRRTFLS